ncbi:MAG: DUF4363 family protein [Firmicutes bacterium]|nr:DUF4363 family protein [Bacillota bacterium]MDY3658730.1 DUF4363 family protein [Eubacteriales bacterium]
MKKAIHISIIILFLVAICLTEQLLYKKYFNETSKKIENLRVIAEISTDINTQEIIDLTNDLEDYWTKKESVLCTFINHKDIEDIGVEISKLKSAIKENEKQIFVESINLISFFLESYEHMIGINAQNIF